MGEDKFKKTEIKPIYVMNSIPNIKRLSFRPVAGALAVISLCCAASAQESYYWRGENWNGDYKTNDACWYANPEGTELRDSPPSSTSDLIFDANNTGMAHARLDQNRAGLAVNSVTATVATEINMYNSMTVLNDWSSYVSADTKYSPTYDSGMIAGKSLRIVANSVNFLTVNGGMELSTDKYFASRFRLGFSGGSSDFRLAVGGALSFVKNGSDTAGYHAFDMIASDSNTGTAFALDLGGLRSSGKAVYMTTAKSGTVGVNFNDNSSGAFAGGSFEGVFATESGVGSQLDIAMNGSGRQEMAIYKSANGSLHGFENDLDGKADMAIGSLAVNSGEFIMNTEVAVENLYLSGGKLKFSSAEKVGGMTIDGGTLLFGGTVNVGDLTVAAYSADIVFSAEDLAAHEITVFEFDYLTDDFDANSVFSAYDESGMKLGGTFTLTGEMGGAGSLVYSVPEPSAIAALIGAAALMFVAALRRRR